MANKFCAIFSYFIFLCLTGRFKLKQHRFLLGVPVEKSVRETVRERESSEYGNGDGIEGKTGEKNSS